MHEIESTNKITLGGNVVSKSKLKLMEESRESQRGALSLTKEM